MVRNFCELQNPPYRHGHVAPLALTCVTFMLSHPLVDVLQPYIRPAGPRAADFCRFFAEYRASTPGIINSGTSQNFPSFECD
jgi:hypothetical protein